MKYKMTDNEIQTIRCNIEAVEGFKFPLNETFNLEVEIEEVKYEFRIHLKDNSDKLLILPTGKITKNTTNNRNKPIFQRENWYFEESTIHINDPTLYINNEIKAGWMIGTKNNWYLETIAEIIKKIADNLFKYDIENQYGNILIYGSTISAFEAIMLSILIKNSTSITEMPYLEVFRTNQRALLNHIFTGMSIQQIHEKYGYRLNVTELIQKEQYIPKIFTFIDYTVNEQYNNDFIAFIKQVTQLPFIKTKNENRIIIELDSKKQGQKQLLKPWQLREIIANIHKIRDKNYYDSSTIQREKIKQQDEKLEQYETKLKKQIQEITKNNKEIEMYKTELNQHIEQIQQNNQEIQQYQKELQQQKQEITKNNKEIQQYKQKQENIIQTQDKTIQKQQQTIQNKTKQIQEKNNKTKQQKNEIKIQKQTIQNKQHIIEIQQKRNKNQQTTIQYYQQKHGLKQKILPYIYILLKSKQKTTSIKLYKKLKNNTYFNIGYYLNKNKDINNKKWTQKLTPLTHYITYGINEKRKPNPQQKTTPENKKTLLKKLNQQKTKIKY